ncbi:hypothetical protein M758_10G028800 [Ceratodon purpureus]|nr:hypothetical protein M758_10G028800 [Ceratodon purpureus]
MKLKRRGDCERQQKQGSGSSRHYNRPSKRGAACDSLIERALSTHARKMKKNLFRRHALQLDNFSIYLTRTTLPSKPEATAPNPTLSHNCRDATWWIATNPRRESFSRKYTKDCNHPSCSSTQIDNFKSPLRTESQSQFNRNSHTSDPRKQ